MKALFLRAGLAGGAALFAILGGLGAQELQASAPYTGLVALWPTFLLALGQALYVVLKKVDDPKLGPALGALFVLPFYAWVARLTIAEEGELFVPVVLSAAPMICLAGLLAGLILDRLPRITIGLSIAMTAVVCIAIVVPSIPRGIFRHHDARPETSDIPSMTLAGVLVIDGAPVVAHGVSYRLQHDAWDKGWCEVVAESNAPQFTNRRASVIYSCKSRPLRCDDTHRMCLVQDEDYATGYTYDYEAIGIHGFHDPDGRVAIRVEAWLLALASLFLLHRARTSPLRHALAMSAMVTSSVAFGMMLRFFEQL